MTTIALKTEAPPQAAVEPTPAETKPDEGLSSKFAALAKKEKWARKLAEDARKEKEEIQREREKFSKERDEYKSNFIDKKRLKDEFLAVAFEAGLTADQIANMLLSQPQGQIDPTIKEMRAEIQALKDELNQTKTGWQDKEKTQYEQAVQQIRGEAESLIAKSDSPYETLKTRPDAADLITRYIEETYKEENRVLKTEDAATFIEEQLLEQAMKTASLKKVQEKLGLNQAPKEEPKKSPTSQQSQMKTLTNAMVPSSNRLSDKDRRARAIMRAQGIDPDSPRA